MKIIASSLDLLVGLKDYIFPPFLNKTHFSTRIQPRKSGLSLVWHVLKEIWRIHSYSLIFELTAFVALFKLPRRSS